MTIQKTLVSLYDYAIEVHAAVQCLQSSQDELECMYICMAVNPEVSQSRLRCSLTTMQVELHHLEIDQTMLLDNDAHHASASANIPRRMIEQIN